MRLLSFRGFIVGSLWIATHGCWRASVTTSSIGSSSVMKSKGMDHDWAWYSRSRGSLLGRRSHRAWPIASCPNITRQIATLPQPGLNADGHVAHYAACPGRRAFSEFKRRINGPSPSPICIPTLLEMEASFRINSALIFCTTHV